MPDWAPEVKCVCVEWDATGCMAGRYSNSYQHLVTTGQRCECDCHSVYEEDMRDLYEEAEVQEGLRARRATT